MSRLSTIYCYITCCAETLGGQAHDFRPSAILRESCSTSKKVQLVDDPEEADLILFVESHRNDARSGHFLGGVRETPIYQKFTNKVAVYSGRDVAFPIIPGIYPSLTIPKARGLSCIGGPYITDPNPFLEAFTWNGKISWLAAFQGSCKGKNVRQKLLALSNETIQVIDSGEDFVRAIRENSQEELNALKMQFVQQMYESKFVLCPRGSGASSFRIFEAMQIGRAPVIIADGWLPPPGPDWQRFAIFVSEDSLERLPEILKTHEARWQEMGEMAQRAWFQFYSPQHLGETIVLQTFNIVNNSARKRLLHRLISSSHFLFPENIRMWRMYQNSRRLLRVALSNSKFKRYHG